MRLTITASGGGHTGHAVAIAQRLSKWAKLTFIVPEGDRWTVSKVRKYGEIIYIKKARGPKDPLWKSIPGLMEAMFQSIIRIDDGEYIIATGSNHCVPPSIISKLRGKKLISIESTIRFTKPSLSLRALSPISDIIILQWPEQRKIHPKGVVVGPLYELPEYKPWDGDYILVTGGTYGHKRLFDAVSETGLENIVLQTGRIDPRRYREKHPKWRIFQFDPDFGRWLAGAKVVITHFGKTALDATLTYRKPTIMVLNPEWIYTAGYEDCIKLSEKLNTIFLSKITPENILASIEEAKTLDIPNYEDGVDNLIKLLDKLL
jgi:UDP-N-acetylglucosamine--N-acetylmuramyl-(pentapeptide) pyrophosphoryl-undecaprenol N-acetylglucosamine transferase